MDLPEEIWETFELLRRGYNGSRILAEAIRSAKREHVQTWQRRFAKRYSEGLGTSAQRQFHFRLRGSSGCKTPSGGSVSSLAS
jgi:hypothetical protein